MKSFTLILLLLLSSFTWAQNLLSDIPALNYGFGNSLSTRMARAEEITATVKRITTDHGINTKVVKLTSKQGSRYSALQILPQGSHPLNQEASRIQRQMSGLPLIFSPYDLSAGSNAFFDPAGTKLGIPYDFFVAGRESSSYQHELIHANTYAELHKGITPKWTGMVQVSKGSFASDVNTNYYFRFAANDEILATALSIKLDAMILAQMKRVMAPAEFNNYHGTAASTVREIYYGALAGYALARQTQSLTARALANLTKAKISQQELALGNAKRSIHVVDFQLESYERAIGGYKAIPGGTNFKLYFAQRPTPNQIQSKLRWMQQKAKVSQEYFKQVEKSIPVLIEYPQIEKVDAQATLQVSSLPYESLSKN